MIQALPLLPHPGQQQGRVGEQGGAALLVLLSALLLLRGQHRREGPQRVRVPRHAQGLAEDGLKDQEEAEVPVECRVCQAVSWTNAFQRDFDRGISPFILQII